jgi:hypothetical protein
VRLGHEVVLIRFVFPPPHFMDWCFLLTGNQIAPFSARKTELSALHEKAITSL